MSDFARILLDAVWIWTTVGGLAVALAAFVAASKGSSLAPLIVMMSVPLQRAVLVGGDGWRLTWTQVALAGFFCGAIWLMLSGKLQIPLDGVTIASFAVVAAYGLSIVVAEHPSRWAAESYRWAVALVFLALARPFATQANAGRHFAFALGVLAVAAAATGIVQGAVRAGPPSFERFGLTRAYGAFGEPNPFGAFAVMITIPCLALAMYRPSEWIGRFGTIAGVGGILATASTQSRGALLGLMAGISVVAAIRWADCGYPFRRFVIPGAVTSTALGVIVCSVMLAGVDNDAEVSPGSWPERERLAHWGAAVRMLLDDPATGIGAGGFTDDFRDNTTEWRFRISQGHAHNAYLQVAAETGVAGLAAYLALLSATVSSLIGRARSLPERWRSQAALGVTVAIGVHGVFDYLHVLSLGIVLAAIWAYGLAGSPRGVALGEHNPSL